MEGKGKVTGNRFPRLRSFLHTYTPKLLLVWLLATLGLVITVMLVYIFVPARDAEISRIGVCLQDLTFNPTEIILESQGRFYICGLIQGTTKYSGTLSVRQYGEAKALLVEPFSSPPGYFYVPIEMSSEFRPGEYVAQIKFTRDFVTAIQFRIIEN